MPNPPVVDLDVKVSPPSLGLDRGVPHLGTMTLTLPVSLERMLENAHDWEHLPWVHASSFAEIDKIDAGPWGWHAWAVLAASDKRVRLELRLESELGRWITRTHEGPGTGSEICTTATALASDRIRLVIDFFSKTRSEDDARMALDRYIALYTTLYQEDLGLMLDRQAGLDSVRAGRATDSDDRVVEVADDLPATVEAFGRSWRVVDTARGLVAHAARCPHQIGSLEQVNVVDGEITCPWHGYRFDVATGECLTGQRCRLPQAPIVERSEVGVVLRQR